MDRSIAPEIKNQIELTKLSVQKEIVNGVEVNYVNGGSAPLLKLELVYNAGSKYQSQPLVASLAFDILRDGSKKINGKAFKEAINGLGVYYGMDVSKDFGTLSFFVLERNFNALLDFIKEVITHPNLPEEEFNRLLQKEKNDFLVDSEKTSFLARQRFAEVLFNESEYGKVDHYKDFDYIDYQISKSFVYDYIVNAPFKLLVSGSISTNSKALFTNFLESLEIESKTNGILLTLKMDSIPDQKDISAWQANSGWFYITLYKVKGDTSRLLPDNLQRGILDLQFIQGDESFQIGLRLKRTVENYEFSMNTKHNRIIGSLHYSTEYLSQLDSMKRKEESQKISGLPDGIRKWLYLTGTGVTLAGTLQNNGEKQGKTGVIMLLSTFLFDQIFKIA